MGQDLSNLIIVEHLFDSGHVGSYTFSGTAETAIYYDTLILYHIYITILGMLNIDDEFDDIDVCMPRAQTCTFEGFPPSKTTCLSPFQSKRGS